MPTTVARATVGGWLIVAVVASWAWRLGGSGAWRLKISAPGATSSPLYFPHLLRPRNWPRAAATGVGR